MKKFADEFKTFVLRGNVMDMAVGVIIGAAFADIVNALTTDFINPLINGLGGAEVAGRTKIYGGQYIEWGHFLTAMINFIIMAFILFLMLKFVNKLMTGRKKKDAKDDTPVKTETDYLEEILIELKKKK